MTSRWWFSLVFAFALSTTASAQTIERTIDITGFNWGADVSARPVDTDGSPSTEEWLVQRPFNEFLVVTVRPGQVCVGEWFSPELPIWSATAVEIVRDGPVDKLIFTVLSGFSFPIVTSGTHVVKVIRLDTPSC